MANITETLIRASNSPVPKKTVNLKGPRWKASPKVKRSLKICKQLYSQWKAAGKIKNHAYHKQLKSEKKILRKQQRYEHAMDRKQLYEKLMTNPTSKQFYQLIKRNKILPPQRNVSRSGTVSVIRLMSSAKRLQNTTRIYLSQGKVNMMIPTLICAQSDRM